VFEHADVTSTSPELGSGEVRQYYYDVPVNKGASPTMLQQDWSYLDQFNDTDFILEVHKLVVASGLPNYIGCRIPLRTKLNIPFWREKLVDYHDQEIIEFLEFGFPLGVIGHIPDNPPCKNHNGANKFPDSIDAYIVEELQAGSIIWPFDKSPFEIPAVFSPLSTVEKRDSTKRRVIMDLSFPEGRSINNMIPKAEYLGAPVRLRYPGVDDLVDMIKIKGRGCAVYKRDLARAFRQFPVDPGQINLLGWTWVRQMYFDLALVMGCTISCYLCQRITDALKYMFRKSGYDLVNYIDDLVSAEFWSRALTAYNFLGKLLKDSGTVERESKACCPESYVIFLGVWFDTPALTLSVTQERLEELKSLLDYWLELPLASRKDLQSIIGKLNFVAACVRQGRVFIARIINHMKSLPGIGKHPIPGAVRKDLLWWSIFLPGYNGVSMMAIEEWSRVDEVFASDACLTGCGAWCVEREYFHAEFPGEIKELDLHINGLEMLTIIVACKLWGRKWQGKRIVIQCDNSASVTVMNTGRTKDEFLQSCLRELAFIAARHEFEIRGVHIPGVLNRVPDVLSRWKQDGGSECQLDQLVGPEYKVQMYVYPGLFRFSHRW
jgi:hypothetical protein